MRIYIWSCILPRDRRGKYVEESEKHSELLKKKISPKKFQILPFQ